MKFFVGNSGLESVGLLFLVAVDFLFFLSNKNLLNNVKNRCKKFTIVSLNK